MRPNTSVRQPLSAGVQQRKLSDLLRTWRRQPRQNSTALFWSLIVVTFAVDAGLLFVGAYLLGVVDPVTPPPSERRMYVPHARNTALWEPLRHAVIRVEGRPRIFESFCREAVRAITGHERFEDNDPVSVVVSWMLSDEFAAQPRSGWDDYPLLSCDNSELRTLLYRDGSPVSPPSREEQLRGVYVEPYVVRHAKGFRKLLRGIAAKGSLATESHPSALEKQALELSNRLALFDRIRGGGMDGGASESASAALREAYQSGSEDLFVAALADFLDASHRAPRGEDAAAARRLVCEGWLNERRPFRLAMVLSLFAAGFLLIARIAGTQRPLCRRGLLVSGLLASAGCLGWSAAGFYCRTILHDGAPVSGGAEVILWAASVAMGLSLVLSLLCRDALVALAGALVSAGGFVLAERWPLPFASNWPTLPSGLAGDVWLNLHVLTAVSAYASLALAWGVAALTVGRLVLAPFDGERLRERAALCARSIGIGLALLVAGAILGAFRTAEPGCCGAAGMAQRWARFSPCRVVPSCSTRAE